MTIRGTLPGCGGGGVWGGIISLDDAPFLPCSHGKGGMSTRSSTSWQASSPAATLASLPVCPSPITTPHPAVQLLGFGAMGIAFLGDTWSQLNSLTPPNTKKLSDNVMLFCVCVYADFLYWDTTDETPEEISRSGKVKQRQRSVVPPRRLFEILQDVLGRGSLYFFHSWGGEEDLQLKEISRLNPGKGVTASVKIAFFFFVSQREQSPVSWRNSRQPWFWVLLVMPWATERAVGKAAPQARRSKRNWSLWGDWGPWNWTLITGPWVMLRWCTWPQQRHL